MTLHYVSLQTNLDSEENVEVFCMCFDGPRQFQESERLYFEFLERFNSNEERNPLDRANFDLQQYRLHGAGESPEILQEAIVRY